MFIFSVIIGLGQGFQPMCGFCYGAKLYDRAKEVFWFSTKVGFTLLLSWAVVFMISYLSILRISLHCHNSLHQRIYFHCLVLVCPNLN
uniref:MATE family efflux transporter n=1 Tax=Alloprevotella sp. TaxID=1872471 RepID=UPI0040264AE6